jgi:hypothetical protein
MINLYKNPPYSNNKFGNSKPNCAPSPASSYNGIKTVLKKNISHPYLPTLQTLLSTSPTQTYIIACTVLRCFRNFSLLQYPFPALSPHPGTLQWCRIRRWTVWMWRSRSAARAKARWQLGQNCVLGMEYVVDCLGELKSVDGEAAEAVEAGD